MTNLKNAIIKLVLKAYMCSLYLSQILRHCTCGHYGHWKRIAHVVCMSIKMCVGL